MLVVIVVLSFVTGGVLAWQYWPEQEIVVEDCTIGEDWCVCPEDCEKPEINKL